MKSIPPRDPTKQMVHHDFPGLPYDAATLSIVALGHGEDECKRSFRAGFKVFVLMWEYGYYDRFFWTSSLEKPESVAPAALLSEGHDSFRSSFLMLAHGYPADAIATLRRVHESFVKACDCAWSPGKTINIVRAKHVRPSERRLGLQLDSLQRVAGGFVHGNKLHSLEALIALHEKRSPEIRYGPRHDQTLGRYAATVSIFWLYFGIKVAPALFPGAAEAGWSAQQADSAGFLRGYLADGGSQLKEECDRVDAMLDARSKGLIPRKYRTIKGHYSMLMILGM